LDRNGLKGDRSRSLNLQERRILSQIAEGCNSEEITSELGLTIDVVHRHKVNLMGKFAVSSISTLIGRALKKRLIDPYEVL